MSVLLLAVPFSILISALAVAAFIYQVKSGQLDDLETPPRRVLFDDWGQQAGRARWNGASNEDFVSRDPLEKR